MLDERLDAADKPEALERLVAIDEETASDDDTGAFRCAAANCGRFAIIGWQARTTLERSRIDGGLERLVTTLPDGDEETDGRDRGPLDEVDDGAADIVTVVTDDAGSAGRLADAVADETLVTAMLL